MRKMETPAERSPIGSECPSGFEVRMEWLERQMAQLILEQGARTSDQERYGELRARARAIGGELEKTFAFTADGQAPVDSVRSTQAAYRRPYWLTREDPSETAAVISGELPRQFWKLELAVARDERAYREKVETLAYADEEPAIRLMYSADFEGKLQKLARQAGGSLEVKAYDGKVRAYYYRYKRLKTATVFCSLLKYAPYHSSGKHRYAFWLPIDYVLLRRMLEKDAEIYAALPEEMRRPGYPASG